MQSSQRFLRKIFFKIPKIFPILAPRGASPFIWANLFPIPYRYFLSNLVEIDPVILEKPFKEKVYAGLAVITHSSSIEPSAQVRELKNVPNAIMITIHELRCSLFSIFFLICLSEAQIVIRNTHTHIYRALYTTDIRLVLINSWSKIRICKMNRYRIFLDRNYSLYSYFRFSVRDN